MLDKRIVWQPIALYQPGHDFGIVVDRKFAGEMLSAKIDEPMERRMNEMAHEFILGNMSLSPLSFYKDTAFVSQFNLGTQGRWLAVDETYGKNPLEVFSGNIKYSSHNVDSTTDSRALMNLVDFWAEYSDILKEGTL